MVELLVAVMCGMGSSRLVGENQDELARWLHKFERCMANSSGICTNNHLAA